VQPENRAEMDVPGYLNGLRGDVPAAFELG
jgi:hypothetical protein